MIVLIMLDSFLALIYATDRLKFSDAIVLLSSIGKTISKKQTHKLVITLSRLIFLIVAFIFFVYAFIFIPYLRLAVSLTLFLSFIYTYFIRKLQKNSDNLHNTFNKRLWITRLDAIITVVIWGLVIFLNPTLPISLVIGGLLW